MPWEMDEVVSADQRQWWLGAGRVVSAWLAIGVAVWAVYLVAMPDTSYRRGAVLIAMVLASAGLSPVYAFVVYLSARRNRQPKTARGALITSAVLFVVSLGAIGFGILVMQTIGRGLR